MSIYLLEIHEVKDYEIWKRVFDSRVESRRKVGCLGGTTYIEYHGITQRAIAVLE